MLSRVEAHAAAVAATDSWRDRVPARPDPARDEAHDRPPAAAERDRLLRYWFGGGRAAYED